MTADIVNEGSCDSFDYQELDNNDSEFTTIAMNDGTFEALSEDADVENYEDWQWMLSYDESTNSLHQSVICSLIHCLPQVWEFLKFQSWKSH
jgi:hypothetical protein